MPNGVAGANGVTWRRACYNAVHCGVLGTHRSADVTTKLLERAVWWPDLAKDVAAWVGKCLACIKGRSRPTKVEARAVKCGAETCWQEVSVDCEGPNREDREGLRYSLTYFDCLRLPCGSSGADAFADALRGAEGLRPVCASQQDDALARAIRQGCRVQERSHGRA